MHRFEPCRRPCLALFVAVLAAAALPQAAAAAEPLTETTSLAFVPADVSFYSSMQRNREVFDRVRGSKFYDAVRNSPAVQLGMIMWQASAQEPESDVARFLEELRKPENVELTDLAADMVSHEIFMYGDDQWALLFDRYNAVYRSMMLEGLRNPELFETDPLGDLEDPDAAAARERALNDKIARQALDASRDLEIPTLVLGFRVTDRDRARRQLDRLDEIMQQVRAELEEELADFARQQLGNGDYLTWTVDGGKLDWGELDDDVETLSPELQREIRQRLEGLTFAMAVGVYGDYVLFSLGPSNEHLAVLGEGELLANRPELAPLHEAANRPITSIAYQSRLMVEQSLYGPQTVELWVEFGKAAVSSEEASLSADLQQKLIAGIDEIGAGIKAWFPQRGPRMSYSWLTDSGFEGYQYNWDENIGYNGEHELTLLEHLGGDPIYFWVTRHKYRPESWDPLIKAGYLMLDAIDEVQFEVEEEEKQAFAKIMRRAKPLVKRAEAIFREQYLPALADGQAAWVLDNKLAKHSWHEAMPPAENPLPIPEFGIVYGVSDLGKLKAAFAEFEQLQHDALQVGREFAEQEGDEFPEPAPPVKRTTDVGELTYYPFDPESGAPEELASTYGLAEKVTVSTYSPSHAIRLMTPTALKVDGVIARHEGPAFDAVYFNWARLVDTATPWIEYTGRMLAQEFDNDPLDDQNLDLQRNDAAELQLRTQIEPPADLAEPDGFDLPDDFDAPNDFGPPALLPQLDQAMLDQIHSWIQFLKCFRQYSSISYMEDGAQVTHYEWQFQDLP